MRILVIVLGILSIIAGMGVAIATYLTARHSGGIVVGQLLLAVILCSVGIILVIGREACERDI